ncbi:MAG: hypothetical protein EBS42_10005 [Caulobacteraceae bacterium]|nr:hypothetical protein [Caulobacteraceae bacterium]
MSSGIRKLAVDCIPPATVAVVVAFWAWAPEAFVANPWTLLGVNSLVTAFVLGLELVLERHEGWRINRQVNIEDKALIERVQAGMASSSYGMGPLSVNEVALRSFARRMRRLLPQSRLARPPAAG